MFENDRTRRPTRIGTERKLSVLTEIMNEHPSSKSLNSITMLSIVTNMDIPMEMKKQLMQMAGITDVNEFDKMASTFAEKNKDVAQNMSNETIQPGIAKKTSPFQGMHANHTSSDHFLISGNTTFLITFVNSFK